jgi:hypothetical protein
MTGGRGGGELKKRGEAERAKSWGKESARSFAFGFWRGAEVWSGGPRKPREASIGSLLLLLSSSLGGGFLKVHSSSYYYFGHVGKRNHGPRPNWVSETQIFC